jgi:hypothetical protein
VRPMRVLIYCLELVLIVVASSALISYVVARPASSRDVKAEEFHAANAAKFKSLCSTGTKDIREARYADALASFREAEQTAGQLSNDEYDLLKNSRQQVASLDEGAGHTAEAQEAYKELFSSATDEGRIRLRASEYDGALVKFQDAEQFADHLTEGKEESLASARGDLIACYRGMHRYEDAVDVGERMIEYLRHNSDEYDRTLTSEYLELAQTYSQAEQWNYAELNLQLANGLSEKRIAHYRDVPGESQVLMQALGDKGYSLYWLIVAYDHEGKTDYALGTAEDLYDWVPNPSAPWSDITPYPRKEVAKLALRIGTAANRKDAIELWNKRLNPGNPTRPVAPVFVPRRP